MEMTIKIINKTNGQKRLVRDKLYKDYFSKIVSNGQKVWVTVDELKEIKAETVEPVSVSSCENKKADSCCGGGMDAYPDLCCKEETQATELNPFDIKDADELKAWLTKNSIAFPKPTKKLESLQKYIPEIYKEN